MEQTGHSGKVLCHCFIWVASIAFSFASVQQSYIRAVRAHPDANIVPSPSFTFETMSFWGLVVSSAAIGGVCMAGAVAVSFSRVVRRRRASNWEPGHVFLLVYGVGVFWANILPYLMTRDQDATVISMLIETLNFAIVCLAPIAFAALWWKWPTRWWKICFASACATALVQVLLDFWPPYHTPLLRSCVAAFFQGLLLVVAGFVSMYDRSQGHIRDAYHWIGVFVVIGINGTNTLWTAWFVLRAHT
jgi:hypothetical protein